MDGFIRDLRFTLRNLTRSPGLAAVVAISLALGIGANTAIFSLMRAILMRSLPVERPSELVLLHWGADAWPRGLDQSGSGGASGTRYRSSSRSLAYPYFQQIRSSSALGSVFAFAPLGSDRQNTTLGVDGSAERVDAEMVSGGYFAGLGVVPSLGRAISDDDERTGARVLVLSHRYWTSRFASDPGVVGRTVTINGTAFAVLGVAPRGFFGVQPGRMPDVWVPMLDAAELVPWGFRPETAPSLLTVRAYWWTHVMARLKPDVSAAQAAAALDAEFQRYVADALPAVDPAQPPHIELEQASAGLDLMRSSYERPLRILMGIVVLVLLIACANVAVLLLSRAMGRRREFAMRLSLGASRARLIRQLLTESLLMALAGGGLGILCGGWTSRALLLLVPAGERPLVDAPIDPAALAFAAAVSAATAVAFGLAPALLATRVDVLPALKQSASGTVASEPPAHRLWSSAFVIAQVALSLVLLMGAALFMRTLVNLQRTPLGVEGDRLLVFGVDASQNGYAGERLLSTYADLQRRLEALPGVEAASATRLRLFSGWVSSGSIGIPGSPPNPVSMNLQSNAVGAGIARTLGLRVLAGRDIEWTDVVGRRRVAVVNEAMATHFFGSANVVGRRYGYGERPEPDAEYEIVGVVSNAKYSQVRGGFPRTAYVPYSAMRGALHGLYFHLRTAGEPLALAPSVRKAVEQIDPGLAVVEMDVMSRQVGDSLWQERLFARLTSAFSLLALALASIGLYGTIAYGVGRRRSEIAVRMALGARYPQVLWMILRKALLLAAAGVVAGVPLALWSGRFVSSLMFGLTPRDPATLGATSILLVLIASLAGYLPARRAALVDPAAALKQD